jgi:hypothetical protein
MLLTSPEDLQLLRKDPTKTIALILAAIAVIVTVVLLIYVAFLNQGRVEIVSLTWADNHPKADFPYVHLDGTVVNSGSFGARQVELLTRIYDSGGTLITTEITNLGDIPADSYKKINIDIRYAGNANRCEATLRWKPFGG